ncbi:hypothetical protein T07_3046 [Trichinella nelsoni]|uniref:Uncharacterized protein n=1 Tax=Trichinella nelsoni TaxID=6336 RepID=A0A0V0SG30_9BILA|nr:hypothetical protein T07_3046 [Trichinella nelsoni]
MMCHCCLPPTFHSEVFPTEWLEKFEDFFYTSDVPASNYGVAGRYLLSDTTQRELYPMGTPQDNSLNELKRSTATQSSMERRTLPKADQRRPRMGEDDFGQMNLVRRRTAGARPIKQPLRRLHRGLS